MVLLYIISLFYNIPLFNIGIEVKLFTLVFVYFFFHFLRNREGIYDFAWSDRVSRSMLKFGLWCGFTFMFGITYMVIIGEVQFVLMSVLYYYHLWGFIIATIFLRKSFLLDIRYFEKMVFAMLVVSVVEGLIILGQNVEAVPYLWAKEYFMAYGGETALTGTLGPNRVVPGTAMYLCFVLAAAVIAARSKLQVSRFLSVFLAILSVVCVVLTGSRTGYISLASFMVFLGLLSPVNIMRALVPAVLVFFLLVKFLDTSAIEERMEFTISWRITEDLAVTQKYASDEGDYYGRLGSGRKGKLERAGNFLLENPWFIPFGGGFNNRFLDAYKAGNSAHNLFLTLVIENGLVGLVLFLGIFVAFVRGNVFERETITLAALTGSALVNMFFGEAFYIFRPSFALLGMLFLVATMVDLMRMSAKVYDLQKE
jgi:O-antigen ligase